MNFNLPYSQKICRFQSLPSNVQNHTMMYEIKVSIIIVLILASFISFISLVNIFCISAWLISKLLFDPLNTSVLSVFQIPIFLYINQTSFFQSLVVNCSQINDFHNSLKRNNYLLNFSFSSYLGKSSKSSRIKLQYLINVSINVFSLTMLDYLIDSIQ